MQGSDGLFFAAGEAGSQSGQAELGHEEAPPVEEGDADVAGVGDPFLTAVGVAAADDLVEFSPEGLPVRALGQAACEDPLPQAGRGEGQKDLARGAGVNGNGHPPMGDEFDGHGRVDGVDAPSLQPLEDGEDAGLVRFGHEPFHLGRGDADQLVVEEVAVIEKKKAHRRAELFRSGLAVDPLLFLQGGEKAVEGAPGDGDARFDLAQRQRFPRGAEELHDPGDPSDGIELFLSLGHVFLQKWDKMSRIFASHPTIAKRGLFVNVGQG